MPEVSPFVAASQGALNHLAQNPLVQQALKAGIFKDIWGNEYSQFMGIDGGGYGAPNGEIPDNTQGRTQAFSADVAVYRCVDLRGAAIASVPLKIFDSMDPTKRVEVEHEAMEVLLKTNPFHWVSGPQLMRYSLGSRDLHGHFAWRIVNDTGGRLRNPLPREIYWLPPGQYAPVSGEDLQPAKPKVPFAGLKIRAARGKGEYFLAANQVVYAPTYNPVDPLHGTSRITSLRTDLNLRLYGANSNLWFFRNNQRPDVVVTGAFSPTPENVGLMRRIWKAAFGGDGNRGPAFLPSDMRVNLLTMSQKDAEWLGQRQAAREDILAAFGVPPPVYGDLSRATYENIRIAYEGFWRSGMIPELDEMAWTLTQQFLWKWPDASKAQLVFAFDYAAIEALQEDANAIWERTMQMIDRLNAAVERRNLLPNQMREIAQALFKAAGLPDAAWTGKIPGGDMFYVRLNEIPISEASVQANVDSLAARAGITHGDVSKPGNGQWKLPDAREVVGDPEELAAQAAQASPPSSPKPVEAPKPAPAVPAKILIHNHLTRLEWPQPPQLPSGRDDGGDPHEADADDGTHGQRSPARFRTPQRYPQQLAARDSDGGDQHQIADEHARQYHAGNSARHAQDWVTRRLKRHFQDQQTAALRYMRAAEKAVTGAAVTDDPAVPSTLHDVESGRRNLTEILDAGLAMAGVAEDVLAVASAIEAETADHLAAATLAAAEDGETPKTYQARVREVFRVAIEERAAAIAGHLVAQREESAA